IGGSSTKEAVSTDRVKVALRKAIDAESKTKPLSDQQLIEILRKQGFQLARRTVAKYREEMRIPPSHLRRTEA
ncbi:MAG: RNA polymerase sigma-54 factor, partial [Candidatus Omnitrophica bacterium]|nr:RNA polymerase sigma-54 factor [Candidatus Omnitrophota bacterium]